jgi:hypothetical protein
MLFINIIILNKKELMRKMEKLKENIERKCKHIFESIKKLMTINYKGAKKTYHMTVNSNQFYNFMMSYFDNIDNDILKHKKIEKLDIFFNL